MADAFYTATDNPDRFVATPHTEGPWEQGVQHGGPPSALLARTVERVPSSIPGPSQVTRLAIEILGPVPIGEVRTSAAVVRPGRSVELVEAELHAAGRPVLRARAWRIRTAPVDLQDTDETPPPGLAPDGLAPDTLPAMLSDNRLMRTGFLNALDWRRVHGGFGVPGPATAWARQRVALVDGERPSGLQRLMALADCGNGLSALFDFTRWWFINVDLTVHLHRLPVGDWLCADAVSMVGTNGVGLARTRLYDTTGRIGYGAQSLMVGRR